MSLLAFGLFTSLVVATVEGGCSSSSSPATTAGSFDSGTVTVPEAGPSAGSVTITVVGQGFVVSAEGTPQDGGPNGFVGPDGGAPIVDCPGSCTAPQGISLYASPAGGNVFNAWSVVADGGSVVISTDPDITITPGIGSPLTATFSTTVNGPDAAAPPVIPDAATGG
jgi:hypothetical protein